MSHKSVISNIDELTCAIDLDFDKYSIIFDQIIGHVVQNSKHTSSFISYVNGLLSNNSSRRRGLVLLSTLIPLCPTEVINEHARAWINNSLKRCENEREVNVVSFEIIKPLLKLCANTPELNKSVVSTILEKVIEEIKSTYFNSPKAEVVLECLFTCLRTYAGPCGSRKIPLEKYLCTYVDSEISTSTVRLAGKCLNSLQQVGGGGNDGINYYNNWNKQQLRMLATIHELMDQFFVSVTEMGDYKQDVENISPILEITQSIESKNYKKIATRIVNSTVFLQEMLMCSYPVKKSVLLLAILNIISRGLSVTRSALGIHVLEDMINLSSYLILIQKSLLELLQCLIVSLGSNLLPWGHLICKLITGILKNISSEDAFSIETISDLRLTCYETLRLWMTVTKGACSVNQYMDKLLPLILDDVTPIKEELNLQLQNDTPRHMSKKERKKIIQQKANEFTEERSRSKTLTKDSSFQRVLCTSALQTLQNILTFIGPLIRIQQHRKIQQFICNTLHAVQRGDELYPYTDEDCQIELYNTLIKLSINYHHSFPPPLQYAMIFLTKGQSNNNPRVSQACFLGLNILNSYVHPPFTTLQFPFDDDEILNELGGKKNVITMQESEDEVDSDVCELIQIDLKISDEENDSNKETETCISPDLQIVIFEEENLINEQQTEKVPEPEMKSKIDIISVETVHIPTDSLQTEAALNSPWTEKLDINKDKEIVLCEEMEEKEKIRRKITSPEEDLPVTKKSKMDESFDKQYEKENDVIEIDDDLEEIIEIKINGNDKFERESVEQVDKASSKIEPEQKTELKKDELDEDEICSSFVDIIN